MRGLIHAQNGFRNFLENFSLLKAFLNFLEIFFPIFLNLEELFKKSLKIFLEKIEIWRLK